MVNLLSKKELSFRLMNPKWKIRLLARDFYYLDFLSGPVQKILGLANILVPPSTILESNIFVISNTRKKDTYKHWIRKIFLFVKNLAVGTIFFLNLNSFLSLVLSAKIR